MEQTSADAGAVREAGQPIAYADPGELIGSIDQALVISDTHWFHDNVVEYCHRPAHHDVLMLSNWYETVGLTDLVLHCGDVAVGVAAEALPERLPALPGRIFLIRGNHDYGKRLRQYASRGWSVVQPFTAEYHGWTVHFSHKPILDLPPRTLNVHGHLHTRPAPSAAHINVSVEQIDYRPTRLSLLLDAAIARIQPDSLARL